MLEHLHPVSQPIMKVETENMTHRECGSSQLYFHLFRCWCQVQKPIKHDDCLHFEMSRNYKKWPMTSGFWLKLDRFITLSKLRSACRFLPFALSSLTTCHTLSVLQFLLALFMIHRELLAPGWADVQEGVYILLTDRECVKDCVHYFHVQFSYLCSEPRQTSSLKLQKPHVIVSLHTHRACLSSVFLLSPSKERLL